MTSTYAKREQQPVIRRRSYTDMEMQAFGASLQPFLSSPTALPLKGELLFHKSKGHVTMEQRPDTAGTSMSDFVVSIRGDKIDQFMEDDNKLKQWHYWVRRALEPRTRSASELF